MPEAVLRLERVEARRIAPGHQILDPLRGERHPRPARGTRSRRPARRRPGRRGGSRRGRPRSRRGRSPGPRRTGPPSPSSSRRGKSSSACCRGQLRAPRTRRTAPCAPEGSSGARDDEVADAVPVKCRHRPRSGASRIPGPSTGSPLQPVGEEILEPDLARETGAAEDHRDRARRDHREVGRPVAVHVADRLGTQGGRPILAPDEAEPLGAAPAPDGRGKAELARRIVAPQVTQKPERPRRLVTRSASPSRSRSTSEGWLWRPSSRRARPAAGAFARSMSAWILGT